VAVKIRLMRTGKKKQPAYRVVVADARSPRDGRFIEILGHYAPRAEPSTFVIDEDRTIGWLTKGAQPTEQVSKLLDTTGVWARFEQETGRAPKARFVLSDAAAKKEKQVKAAPAAEAPAAVEVPAAPAPEPVAEEAAEEPAAEAPAQEPVAEAPAEEPAAEAPAEEPAGE
jgi:small subunit ribosomal protein S16